MAVNATAIWRVRPSGNNANGGGYDPGISSPGTDYSQQNSPQVTFNGSTVTAVTAGASATITITGYTVAATDVANALNITGGTNFTAGWYFIQSVNTGSNTWTLDRNVATGVGAAMTGRMGGGWADFFTNPASGGPLVPGNFVYILGSGIPNPASYTYDYTTGTFFTPASGSATTGNITYACDPATPSYASGGRPVIKCGPTRAALFFNAANIAIQELYFVAAVADIPIVCPNAQPQNEVRSCVLDQFGYDIGLAGQSPANIQVFGCEVFSSVAARGTTAQYAITTGNYGSSVIGNNIHDTVGPGINLATLGTVSGNIVAKVTGDGILVSDPGVSSYGTAVLNNTVDGCIGGYGIEFANQEAMAISVCVGNLITNNTGAGKAGLRVSSGTAAANDLVKRLFDYNSFYNNTANYSGISAGAHDVTLGSSPYVAQSTENYALA
jgi:hypothetical protein